MCSEILNWDAVEKADKSSVNKIYSSIVDSSGLSHPSGIKLLPFPLELMSKKQTEWKQSSDVYESYCFDCVATRKLLNPKWIRKEANGVKMDPKWSQMGAKINAKSLPITLQK